MARLAIVDDITRGRGRRAVARYAAAACAAVACAAIAAACANPGLPAYDKSRPRPLTPAGEPRPAKTVRIEMKSLPWWTVAGTSTSFILGFDDRATAPSRGTRIGAVRSRDIELDDHVFDAVRCAWLVVPLGESRPCGALTRTEAMAIARDAITEARAELRAHAADAGVDVVSDVRCFAERESDRSRLWCEGVALVVDRSRDDRVALVPSAPPSFDDPAAPIDREPAAVLDDPAAPIGDDPAAALDDPAAPIDHEPRLTETRLVLVADASVGMLGRRPLVGSTLGLRYRPIELGLYILDLQRDSLAPRDDGLVGLGVTALGRFAIGRSRADVIVGGSALTAAINNTTNPQFGSLYHGFAGVAYQTPWRIAGAAQPFVQLRAGAAYGSVIASRALPMLELHVGLTSPERR